MFRRIRCTTVGACRLRSAWGAARTKKTLGMAGVALSLSLSLRASFHFIYISLTLLSGSIDHMVETGRLDHLVDTFSLITWSKLVGLTIWSMLIGLANWSMLGGREFVDASTESPLVSILASKCFDCMLCL